MRRRWTLATLPAALLLVGPSCSNGSSETDRQIWAETTTAFSAARLGVDDEGLTTELPCRDRDAQADSQPPTAVVATAQRLNTAAADRRVVQWAEVIESAGFTAEHPPRAMKDNLFAGPAFSAGRSVEGRDLRAVIRVGNVKHDKRRVELNVFFYSSDCFS